MPDQDPEPRPPDQYKVIGLYGDNALPPLVPDDVAAWNTYLTRADADVAIEELVARTDIGRIILYTNVHGEFLPLHTWNRVGSFWQYERRP